jgi:hypothetical protein
MKAIDRVRNAYQAKKRSIVIPEWDNLELWFGPITVDDMESIEARVKNQDSNYERNLLLIIHKATDADGKNLFNFGDRTYLEKQADLTVLQRIIVFLWEGVPGMDEAKELVRENPPSDSG